MGIGIKCFVVTLFAWLTLRFLSKQDDTNYRALLDSKNVIITGASSGIGEEAALYCAQLGANIVIVARREQLLRQVVEKLRRINPNVKAKLKYIVADLNDSDIGASIVSEAASYLGGIDYLILNHALLPTTLNHVSQWQGSKEQLDRLFRTMATNFYSFVTISDQAIPHLRQSNGSLLVVSSALVDSPAFSLPYSVSKSSINTFYTGLRQEFITTSTNVSVTIMNMGFIATDSSLVTMKQMSISSGRDLSKLLSIFPQTSAKEGGRALVEAIARREAYVYFPKNQKLWLYRCLRVILTDPDKWSQWAERKIIKFVDWRDYLASKLIW